MEAARLEVMSHGAKTKSKDRFRQGRDRGCRFLMRQLRPDGGFGSP